ncbi:hypothetical protein KC359_g173 [Hortaea werneckii]|nr:hypothetical protein KC359_g173 [Hortaea werneckii]KAI7514922.1 hypothetical protein KC347_g164 [Hortaea werneckii]
MVLNPFDPIAVPAADACFDVVASSGGLMAPIVAKRCYAFEFGAIKSHRHCVLKAVSAMLYTVHPPATTSAVDRDAVAQRRRTYLRAANKPVVGEVAAFVVFGPTTTVTKRRRRRIEWYGTVDDSNGLLRVVQGQRRGRRRKDGRAGGSTMTVVAIRADTTDLTLGSLLGLASSLPAWRARVNQTGMYAGCTSFKSSVRNFPSMKFMQLAHGGREPRYRTVCSHRVASMAVLLGLRKEW